MPTYEISRRMDVGMGLGPINHSVKWFLKLVVVQASGRLVLKPEVPPNDWAGLLATVSSSLLRRNSPRTAKVGESERGDSENLLTEFRRWNKRECERIRYGPNPAGPPPRPSPVASAPTDRSSTTSALAWTKRGKNPKQKRIVSHDLQL